MSTASLRRRYTFEEFRALVRDGQKADLIDGTIYMASPDNTEANEICGWLYGILLFFLDAKGLGGKLHAERVAYRLDGGSGPEPDIGYVGPGKVKFVYPGYVDCEPDLAVEIVSEESKERDYFLKRSAYEQSGVKEYLIIDPLIHRVTYLRLGRDGVFKPVRPRQGVYRSRVIRGFWFDPGWFWQQPLPGPSGVLARLLASAS